MGRGGREGHVNSHFMDSVGLSVCGTEVIHWYIWLRGAARDESECGGVGYLFLAEFSRKKCSDSW
jgi:hypothetical protein